MPQNIQIYLMNIPAKALFILSLIILHIYAVYGLIHKSKKVVHMLDKLKGNKKNSKDTPPDSKPDENRVADVGGKSGR